MYHWTRVSDFSPRSLNAKEHRHAQRVHAQLLQTPGAMVSTEVSTLVCTMVGAVVAATVSINFSAMVGAAVGADLGAGAGAMSLQWLT